MRAVRRLAFLACTAVFSAAPLIAVAQALPPPPYASDQTYSGRQDPQYALAAPQTMDRYGGGLRAPSPRQANNSIGASPSAPSGLYLAWSGKAQPGMASQGGGPASAPYWAAEPQGREAQTPARPSASTDWRPYRPQTSGGLQSPPTSIYDAPPQMRRTGPAPQPYQQAQAAPPNVQGGPRFYSLHRDYGIQPDAIPLPPQFFGPTADLSAPATDPLARRTTSINGQTKTVNVPDDQGAQ